MKSLTDMAALSIYASLPMFKFGFIEFTLLMANGCLDHIISKISVQHVWGSRRSTTERYIDCGPSAYSS